VDLDEITLERAARGDRGAFRTLVERYQKQVFALIGRIVGRADWALVDDLAQETFVRVFRALPRFGEDGRMRPGAWISTIAARVAIDELRRRGTRLAQVDGAQVCDIAGEDHADGLAERRGLQRAIERAVEQLAPEYRAAFLLREVHELAYDEIAETLGIDLGTVKSRLSRARAALRVALSRIHEEG
jgi:RNA polymerase sigma-70 factor (ECF subfamily)